MNPAHELAAQVARHLHQGAAHAVRVVIEGTFERLTGEPASGAPERLVRDLWERELLHDDAALYLLGFLGAVRTVGGPVQERVRDAVASTFRSLPGKTMATLTRPLLRAA